MNISKLLPTKRVINMFGAVGYTLLIFSFVLTISAVMLFMINSGLLNEMGLQPQKIARTAVVNTNSVMGDSFFMQIVSGFVITIAAAFVLFTLVALPYWMGKGGSMGLKYAIRYCKQQVTPTSLLIGKIIACGVCVVPSLIYAIYNPKSLPVVITQLILTSLALAIFLVQHYIAHTSNIIYAKNIW